MSRNKNLKLPWPDNLLADLWSDYAFENHSDQMEGLCFAINDLKEIERKALLLRYKEGRKSQEIASILNCSAGYVGTICEKARIRLKHPCRSKYILYGLQGVKKKEQEILEEKQKKIEAIRNMQSIEEKIAALSHTTLDDGGLSEEIIKKLRYSHIYRMTQLIEIVLYNPQKLNNNKRLSRDNIDQIIDILYAYGFFYNNKGKEYSQKPFCIERYFDVGQEVSNTELSLLCKCHRTGKLREARDTKDIIIIANYCKDAKDEWRDGILYLRGAKIPQGQNVPGAWNNRLEKKLRTNGKAYLFEAIDKEKYIYCGRIELADNPFMKTRRGSGGILLYNRIFPLRLVSEKNNLESLQESL